MVDCKSCSTPIASCAQLSNMRATQLPDPTEFQQLVGYFHYLTLTLLDNAFVVNHVAQFIAHLHTMHLSIAFTLRQGHLGA